MKTTSVSIVIGWIGVSINSEIMTSAGASGELGIPLSPSKLA